jgi:hypothetical protein
MAQPGMIDTHKLASLTDDLDVAGIDHDLAGIAAALYAGTARVTAQIDDLLDDSAEVRIRSYLAWADGDLDAAAIVGREALNLTTGEGRDIVIRMRRAGLAAVEARATYSVRGQGETLFARMQDRDADLLEQVETNAPAIDGIVTAQQAMDASPKARTAWGAIADAIRGRSALAHAYRTLQSVKAVPTIRGLDERRLHYRDPLALDDIIRRGDMDPIRRIIAEIEVGARPGLYSAAEAQAGLEADIASGDVVTFNRYDLEMPEGVNVAPGTTDRAIRERSGLKGSGPRLPLPPLDAA